MCCFSSILLLFELLATHSIVQNTPTHIIIENTNLTFESGSTVL